MSAGRPRTYHKEYIKKIDDYLAECEDEKYDYHETMGKVDVYKERYHVNLPTIEGFALYIKVSRKTIYNWEKENDDFAEALDRIRMVQKERVINSGLAGKYSPVIAKLILSTNHGMKERSDITSDDKPLESNFTDEQFNRIAERLTGRKRGSVNTPSKK